MNVIRIPGVYTPEVSNFFVDSFAKYIRENNYPEWSCQEVEIVGKEAIFKYLISRDDTSGDSLRELAEVCHEDVDISLGVLYKVYNRDFTMLIDGHYYWATT